MKIKRYIGDECDSINGFNNGYYFDEEPIEVKDEEDAMKMCKEALHSLYTFKDEELENYCNTYQLITGYFDKDGNEITKEEFEKQDNEDNGYRYVYCNFEEMTE